MEILLPRLPEGFTLGGAEWTSSTILWATGGARVACGYGCVARVAIGHKTCKVMFNSDDLLDIGLGCHSWVTVWRRH